jgi:hypothetical protein
MLGPRLLAAAALVAVIGVAASVAAALPGSGRSPAVQAVAKPFVGKLSYHESNHGATVGAATKGVVGNGVFSGKLGGKILMAATLAELVKNVPAAAMAKGGKWVAKYDIDAKGDYKGIVVALFTSKGLGSVCMSGTTKHGKFTSGFIPASGTLTALGGTGTAAKLRLAVTFKQTAITGSDTEQFTGSGAFKTLSMGAAKPMTAACKAVAKLKH